MALLRAAALPAEGSPAWLPTHVQVTVVRARGLRCKGGGGGKPGTSDAYTIIQLGREKYSTSVAEKSTGSPEWREECAFELPPELGGAAGPARAGLLLTVMHRALVGMDRFLGQATVPLEPALQRGRAPDERWYKLHSKAGKKEKERGEILVSIQFTRNNLTASMFDLSMKDKPRSPFGKLKDKVKGKKKYDLESASAIIPSSMGALDMEDDYDTGGKKSKVKGFFLKNKLRKSSLTQSNTSLGSDSTISSASLGLAANVPELPKSPSRHSSLSMERSVKDFLPSPKLTHKRAFSDDISQVSPVLEPKAPQDLEPKSDPVCRSSLCINGSHVYRQEPAARSPLPPAARRQHDAFAFPPIQPHCHDGPQQREEPRFIPSPPSLALQEELKVSTKAVTLSNHLGRARMEENGRLESKAGQASAASVETGKDKQAEESRREEKKAKGGLFQHGGNTGSKGQGEKAGPSPGPSAADERSKGSGWFGSKEPKESPQKPSFPSGPHTSPEVAGSFYSSEDCSPSASQRHKDSERESPAQSVCLPVPETTPPSQGDLPPPPPPHEKPSVPSPLSEWDDTFDAFATSRLKPELKDSLLASVVAEGMAFIDEPDGASPTETMAEAAAGKGTKAEAQTAAEMPPALRPWTNFSGLDVGANLVSTTQEATVIEDVLSPVSAGSVGRRKSSTPTVWTAAFAGDKEPPTPGTAEHSAREEGQGHEEEPCSAGTNGWMTIATETAPDPPESSRSVAAGEPPGAFGPRSPFLSDASFQASRSSRSAACVLPRSSFSPEPPPEPSLAGSPCAGSEGRALDVRPSVLRLQAGMGLGAGPARLQLGPDLRDRHVVLSPWMGPQHREEGAVGPAVPPPKPPRWFTGEEEGVCHPQLREEAEGLEAPELLSHRSSEAAIPASSVPPALGADGAEGDGEFPTSEDAKAAPADSAAAWEARAGELAEGATPVAGDCSERSQGHASEQLRACPWELSRDGSGQAASARWGPSGRRLPARSRSPRDSPPLPSQTWASPRPCGRLWRSRRQPDSPRG
ncbi:LOW QUALITY PROTEIN: rab11 family-interacting protein 5 [Colius striatus]|uniref:LOW QUALITY PROTEIN: rab11 family-interacting protein 5 n=1 Tax=Colius striatus TaxID=57412 RepID=UPI002B1E4642|nr:LOW QUALITY PROTEIN: rab11 family-interacting protein 5 [Colius striatus]